MQMAALERYRIVRGPNLRSIRIAVHQFRTLYPRAGVRTLMIQDGDGPLQCLEVKIESIVRRHRKTRTVDILCRMVRQPSPKAILHITLATDGSSGSVRWCTSAFGGIDPSIYFVAA